MASRILIAGIGNIFLTDDGFGPEVIRHVAGRFTGDETVRVVDYGIGGMHLAYDLLGMVDYGWEMRLVVGKELGRPVSVFSTAVRSATCNSLQM